MSENEEYSAKPFIPDPQQVHFFACFAARHPIVHGSLKQPQTTARGQQTQSKQALQRHSVVLSQHCEEPKEEQEQEVELDLELGVGVGVGVGVLIVSL